MSVYQRDPEMAPDEAFVPGELALLVPGNNCRLLDPRRTPGTVEQVQVEHGMFRWRITAFEDTGKAWDVPIEDVVRYQFEPNAARLGDEQVDELREQAAHFQAWKAIEPSLEAQRQTERRIAALAGEADRWLAAHASFSGSEASINWASRRGPSALCDDLLAYLGQHGLGDLERRTAELTVLNRRSGEWMKGMEILLAEMGLLRFRDRIPRTPDIFEGEGTRELRRRYLLHRLAFVRAAFARLGLTQVVLYRGASAEQGWRRRQVRGLVSMTFSLRVARALADFDRKSAQQHAFLVKQTVPIERLLMTYLETAAMNEQYLEAEALVLGEDPAFQPHETGALDPEHDPAGSQRSGA